MLFMVINVNFQETGRILQMTELQLLQKTESYKTLYFNSVLINKICKNGRGQLIGFKESTCYCQAFKIDTFPLVAHTIKPRDIPVLNGVWIWLSFSSLGLNQLPFDPANNNEPLQFGSASGPLVTEGLIENGGESSKKRKRTNAPSGKLGNNPCS